MRRFPAFSLIAGALCASVLALAVGVISPAGALQAQTAPSGYIGGVVQGPDGPEAGVWVIAETTDLPTRFIKIVVTDDLGRFAVPELPAAGYSVWVRGYGLVDSKPVQMKPTTETVTLRAEAARTPQEAARIYPGNYWLSMLEPPPVTMFPGTGDSGNGVATGMQTQSQWLNSLKSDCNFCHQLGNGITRTLDHVFKAKPELKTHEEAWEWRLGTGVRGNNMYGVLATQGRPAALEAWADWSRRIQAGDVPPAPPRPSGIERNVVLTLWDWGTDHSFMHDEISTDKRNPTVNAGGPVYAVSSGHGALTLVDPKTHSTEEIEIPTRAAREEVPSRFPRPNRPSFWWGDRHLWANPPFNPSDPHNAMLDENGLVWMTSKIRPNANPAWCSDPSNRFAAWFPLQSSGRQASYYDPRTKEFVLIDTCYATHHLQFDTDPNSTVYFNELSGPIIGWIDTKVYLETKNERLANGWCGQVLDTNGDGRITRPWNRQIGRGPSALYASDTGGATPVQGAAATQPSASYDPTLDTIVSYNLYSVIPSPVDDSVWGVSEQYPGYLVRMQRGDNPPESCLTQLFRVPDPGFDPRGVDIDTNGVVWTALAGSSHLASFDVRKCTDLKGPARPDGSQCREGWTLHRTTGPRLQGTEVPADFHYYNWVDQHDVLGMGRNRPIATGSNSDSLLVLDPATSQWTTLRVPYPLGFYSRGLDGRIDDPKAGWKGRGLYANYGTHFVWHIEGGFGTKGKLVKFQLRPDPLAR